jgi:hypothetical protein
MCNKNVVFGVKFNNFNTRPSRQTGDLVVKNLHTSRSAYIFEKKPEQNTDNKNPERVGFLLFNPVKLFTTEKFKLFGGHAQGGETDSKSYLQGEHMFNSYRITSTRRSKILNKSVLGRETTL